jgi:hypothetical protein
MHFRPFLGITSDTDFEIGFSTLWPEIKVWLGGGGGYIFESSI